MVSGRVPKARDTLSLPRDNTDRLNYVGIYNFYRVSNCHGIVVGGRARFRY